MKVIIPPRLSKHDVKTVAKLCDKEASERVIKALLLMCIAMHDELGIGADRLKRVLLTLGKLSEEYEGFKRDDIADEKLMLKIKEIGLPLDGVLKGV